MNEKLEKIRREIQKENFLFTNFIETFYLTKATFEGFWLLSLKGKFFVVCSKMIENQVANYFENDEVEIRTSSSFSKTIVEILKENKENTLIIDAKYCITCDFLILEQRLKSENICIKTKAGILDDFRMIKTESEQKNIQKSCEIVSNVLSQIRQELKPGLSELDIFYGILELFAKNHVKESFTPIVAAGKNSANPHHSSSNYKLKQNDVVMIDLGCVYKGYCSDLTRTYYLGKISPKFEKIWNIVKESQNAVIKNIKAGVQVSRADETARNVINSFGYEDKFIHTTGHGVGIEIHESPSLSLKAKGVFLSQMVITVEPGIYLPNEFGVRIEDTIIVKDKGCKILTKAPY